MWTQENDRNLKLARRNLHTLTISPAVEATRTMKSRKQSKLLLLGYVRPMEELETNGRNTLKLKSRPLHLSESSGVQMGLHFSAVWTSGQRPVRNLRPL